MTAKPSPRQTIGYGAAAGVVASIPMAMYAMIAAWEKGAGFFTPLYHIASLIAPDGSMTTSMQKAVAGENFHFALGTAILGTMIHMVAGAGYGAVFELVASRLHLRRGLLAAAGLGYGAIVFAMSAFIGLPLAAAVFGSGDPIRNMAEMAGWGTFAIEHLIFGLVLGLVAGVLGQRATRTAKPLSKAHSS
jgi:hypothetical protein